MLRFDHAVLVVADLNAAMRRFATLGFTVASGGTHAGGRTRNALIGLDDGGYLELLAPTPSFDPAAVDLQALDPFARRFTEHVRGRPGPVDFALRSDDLDADMKRLRAGGLNVLGPFPGERVRPDGERLAWRIALLDAPGLPFLIADVTPTERRLPTPAPHANGVAAVETLTVASPNPEATADRFRVLLDTPPGDPNLRIGPVGLRLMIGNAGLRSLRLATRGGSPRRLCLTHGERYALLPCPP